MGLSLCLIDDLPSLYVKVIQKIKKFFFRMMLSFRQCYQKLIKKKRNPEEMKNNQKPFPLQSNNFIAQPN